MSRYISADSLVPFTLSHTFFTLQSHSGLQVVHLQLETFQSAVSVPRLPLIGDQHGDDDQKQQAATPADANNGGKRQQAVRVDVKSPRGVLKAPSADLDTHTYMVDNNQGRVFFFLLKTTFL